MVNVFFIYENEMPSSTMMIQEAKMSSPKYIEVRDKRAVDVTSNDIDWSDTVIFIRPQSVVTSKIARAAKKAGCFVISYLDDDLLNLPKGIPDIPWKRRGLIKTIKSSDLLESTSQYICLKYKDMTIQKRFANADTSIPEAEIKDVYYKAKEEFPIRIVYAAGDSHAQIFNNLILPILPTLKDKYGDKVSLAFVGVKPNIEECSKYLNVEYYKGMPLLEYRKFMRNSHFDIGIAPLIDNEFNKCKYFNKFIEYTLVGVPGIYSNNEPYTFVIENNVNGLLANNTSEDWCFNICKMIDDFVLRKSIFDNAKSKLQTNFNSEYLTDRYAKDVPEYFCKRETKKKCNLHTIKFKFYIFNLLEIVYLFFYYSKYEGVKKTISRIKERLKK